MEFEEDWSTQRITAPAAAPVEEEDDGDDVPPAADGAEDEGAWDAAPAPPPSPPPAAAAAAAAAGPSPAADIELLSSSSDETDVPAAAAAAGGGAAPKRPAPTGTGTLLGHFKRNALAVLMDARPGPSRKRPRAGAGESAVAGGLAPPRRRSSVGGRRSSTGGGGGGGGFGRAPPPGAACPFFKRVPGTPFIVDGFHYVSPTVSKHYVLTHFHSDHYGGLTRHFPEGCTIYASPITCRLVAERLGVPRSRLRPIPLDTPTPLCGATVTLIEANHCPGAALFLFELPAAEPPAPPRAARAILHTGDFRFSRAMLAHPALRAYTAGAGGGGRRLDALYLDTTYAHPSHAFPPQEAVVAAATALFAGLRGDPATLFLYGAYTIGKEKMFLAASEAGGGERVFVPAPKRRVLDAVGLPPRAAAALTGLAATARIHVVPMAHLSLRRLETTLKRVTAAAGGGGGGPAAPPPAGAGQSKLPFAPLPKKGGSAFRPGASASGGAGKGRGPLFAALMEASKAAAAAAANVAAAGAGAGAAGGEEAAAAPTPTPAPTGASPLKPQGPFRSIVAFRPTGWAFSGAAGEAAAPAGEGDAEDLPRLPTGAWRHDEGGSAEGGVAEVRAAGVEVMTVVVPPGGAVVVPYTVQKRAGGRVTLFSLPYSEHSSWGELREAVAGLAWHPSTRVVPTVNARSAEAAERMVDALRA
jgi:DNA cross-link repair 1A protein